MRQLVTNILTRDLERSTAFYRMLTGMTVIGHGDVFSLLAAADGTGGQLCLIDWVSELVPRAARGIPEGNYLTLVTEDVAAAVAAARQFGVEVIEETPVQAGTLVQAVIRDLDGRVVELVTPSAHLAQVPQATIA